MIGEVLWVDRFGNAQLNIDPDEIDDFGDRVAIGVAGNRRVARRVEAFASLGPGELGLVVDSYGLLALVPRSALGGRRPAGRGGHRGAPVVAG